MGSYPSPRSVSCMRVACRCVRCRNPYPFYWLRGVGRGMQGNLFVSDFRKGHLVRVWWDAATQSYAQEIHLQQGFHRFLGIASTPGDPWVYVVVSDRKIYCFPPPFNTCANAPQNGKLYMCSVSVDDEMTQNSPFYETTFPMVMHFFLCFLPAPSPRVGWRMLLACCLACLYGGPFLSVLLNYSVRRDKCLFFAFSPVPAICGCGYFAGPAGSFFRVRCR